MAGKRFEPTDAEREIVRGLAAYGAGLAAIRFELFVARDKLAPERLKGPGADRPLSEKTLARVFRPELERGLESANARVGESLFKRAINLKHPQGAICAMFWMKTRAGWIEKPTKVEHSGRVTWELDLEGATLEEVQVIERVVARQAAKLGAAAPANDVAA